MIRKKRKITNIHSKIEAELRRFEASARRNRLGQAGKSWGGPCHQACREMYIGQVGDAEKYHRVLYGGPGAHLKGAVRGLSWLRRKLSTHSKSQTFLLKLLG